MPVKHARSGTSGLPPFGRRGGIGKKGSTRSHSASGSSGAAIAVQTTAWHLVDAPMCGADARFCYALLEKGALEFFDRLKIPAGTRLLDVACGAGQLTLPAAMKGIQVTGLDLAANLQQARTKAAEGGLRIQVDEGDAEDLPYSDGSFDVVMSLIGSMFAPRPELVASEMVRVCRPGGRIIMGNWTPEGFIGHMFKVIGKHVPPPQHSPSPLLWGDEAICSQRLGASAKDLRITHYMYPFEYPFAPAKVVDFFIELLRSDQPGVFFAHRRRPKGVARSDRALDQEQRRHGWHDPGSGRVHRSHRHSRVKAGRGVT